MGKSEKENRSSVFSDHLTLYLDLLGVTDAANSWDEARSSELIKLLLRLAASKSEFELDGESMPDGGFKFKISAEISTFSDHVVSSYLISKTKNQKLIDLQITMFTDQAQRIAASMARDALNIGLLVRGGLTVGKLFHEQGVVFGEAMIDAFQLESRTSIYPRVAVSSAIYDHFDARKYLEQDADKIWHLNYVQRMVDSVPSGDRKGWMENHLHKVSSSIDDLEKNDKKREAEKWRWFKTKLEAAKL